MKMRFVMSVAALLMCASAGSMAASPPFSGEATLAKAVAAASEVLVDGVTWRCEGTRCQGRAERRSTLDSQVKECRKVAAVFGEITAYTSRGREMTKGSVETCNRLATSEKEEMLADK